MNNPADFFVTGLYFFLSSLSYASLAVRSFHVGAKKRSIRDEGENAHLHPARSQIILHEAAHEQVEPRITRAYRLGRQLAEVAIPGHLVPGVVGDLVLEQAAALALDLG